MSGYMDRRVTPPKRPGYPAQSYRHLHVNMPLGVF